MEIGLSREKIKELCDEVEGSFGMKATTPKHFERLAVLIFERTGTLLSPHNSQKNLGLSAGGIHSASHYTRPLGAMLRLEIV